MKSSCMHVRRSSHTHIRPMLQGPTSGKWKNANFSVGSGKRSIDHTRTRTHPHLPLSLGVEVVIKIKKAPNFARAQFWPKSA